MNRSANDNQYLPLIQMDPKREANAAVIWLHGLGASGHDFASLVPMLSLPEELSIRFVFPHAPEMPVTINGGYVMPAWYDVLALLPKRKVNFKHLYRSVEQVHHLIEREVARGIPSEKIVLAGFSQGGAVAYHAALSYSRPLAGLLALSTYLVEDPDLLKDGANCDLSIGIAHGRRDPVVPERMGRDAFNVLKAMGYQPEFAVFDMEHEVCPQELTYITDCFTRFLKS